MSEKNKSDYVSRIEIKREGGPDRLALMPVGDSPVEFGMHGAIAEHYDMDPDAYDSRNTTLDYLVAAAGG